MRKLLFILIALMVAGVQFSAVLSREATPAVDREGLIEQVRRGEACAWPATVAIDALNIAYPDGNATYFAMPYILGPDKTLIVEGAFPLARFSSLTTYYGMGIPGAAIELLGWARDTQIQPDAGSSNPTVDPGASLDPAERRWTVRVTGTAAVDGGTPAPISGDGNVIPAHPEGATDQLGLLVLRVYVPDDLSDPTGGVGLPTLTIEDRNGDRHELGTCSAEESATWGAVINDLIEVAVASAPVLPLPPDAITEPEWVRSSVPGLGPNPDNRYLMGPVVSEPGRIVVIRGKAPTFPDTGAGESASTPADLRYWSFCTGSNVTPYATTACVGDFEVPLDTDGFYTIVVSQAEDRPANATPENGVAWLQGADPTLPDLVILRHMLPSGGFFDQSVWAVPERTPGAAEAIMGPYFPQTVYCDTATFEAGGADACFAASEATPNVATPAN